MHLERYLFKNRQSNHWIFIHLAIELFTPIIAFNYFEFNPIAASVCCVFYSMIFLKLVSYHMVNYWCRMKLIIDKQFDSFNQINGLNRSDTQSNPIQSLCDNKNDKDQAVVDGIEQSKQIQYPNNLNLKDIYYFMVVPTLCYELNFPRTRRIRKTFLIKRFLEIVSYKSVGISKFPIIVVFFFDKIRFFCFNYKLVSVSNGYGQRSKTLLSHSWKCHSAKCWNVF